MLLATQRRKINVVYPPPQNLSTLLAVSLKRISEEITSNHPLLFLVRSLSRPSLLFLAVPLGFIFFSFYFANRFLVLFAPRRFLLFLEVKQLSKFRKIRKIRNRNEI